MTAHGLSNAAAIPSADPNYDGISNIESWLLRLNPAGLNSASNLARRQTITGAPNDPGLVMLIPSPLPSDVKIVFSESSSLQSFTILAQRNGFGTGSSWTGSGAGRVLQNTNASGTTLTLRASVAAQPRSSHFLRTSCELISPGGLN